MTTVTPRESRLATGVTYVITLMLVVIGVLMVYNASYPQQLAANEDGMLYVKKQLLYTGMGMLMMVGMMRVGYRSLRPLAMPLIVITAFLLLAVYIPGIGSATKGAYRWINIKGFSFQPSEIAKLSVILYLAALLSHKRYPIRELNFFLWPALTVICLIAFVVEREPDLGTAMVIVGTGLSVLFFAGARIRHLVSVIGVLVVVCALMVSFASHRTHRMATFLNPQAYAKKEGFQVWRSLVAIGSGGIVGLGFGSGREKFVLPEARTDFIFSTVGEEMGFVGSATLVLLLGSLGVSGFWISSRCEDRFAMLLSGGIAAMISLQALINLLVATGSMPATGVPLPFISYGGTSIIVLLASVGILLSVSQSLGLQRRPGVLMPAKSAAE